MIELTKIIKLRKGLVLLVWPEPMGDIHPLTPWIKDLLLEI